MKSTILSALIVCSVCVASFAADDKKDKKEKSASKVEMNAFSVQSNNARIVKLFVLNNQDWVRVQIRNSDGMLVHTEMVRNVVSFGRKYNLSNLEAGTYTVTVSNSAGTQTQQVTI